MDIKLDEKAQARVEELCTSLLGSFRNAHEKDWQSRDTEFLRGALAGWRHTLQAIIGEVETRTLMDRIRSASGYKFPHCGAPAPDGYFGMDSDMG